MKLKNLFYLLLALPLALAACEPEPDVQPAKDPVLKLTSEATLNFEAKGGEGTITYTLENAVEATKLEATCADAWVKDLTPGEQVTFTVAANEATEARETKVVVTYGKASFEVAVKQAAKAADEENKDDENKDEENKDDENKDEEDKDDEQQTPAGIVFELVSEPVLKVSAKAAMCEVEYNLVDPMSMGKIVFVNTADWITNLEAEEGVISFKVGANKVEEIREAKVVVNYVNKNNEDTVISHIEFTVEQAAYVVPEPVLYFQDKEVRLYHTASTENKLVYQLENGVENPEFTAVADADSADWITEIVVGEQFITFSVSENEGEERTGTITATYKTDKYTVTASVKITQVKNGFDPNISYSEFVITKVSASIHAPGIWKLRLTEWNEVDHEMNTDIYVRSDNPIHIGDGTYSVSMGSIIPGANNMYSKYRENSSDKFEEITDAELTMAIDKDNKTAKFSGKFATASAVVVFAYDGDVDGFSYREVAGTIDCNEWGSAWKQYHDIGTFLMYAETADGLVKFMFSFKHSGGTTLLPAGTYNVEEFEMGKTDYLLDSKVTYDGVEKWLASGSVKVEHVSSGFKLTIDLYDETNFHYVGVFEGTITGATLP